MRSHLLKNVCFALFLIAGALAGVTTFTIAQAPPPPADQLVLECGPPADVGDRIDTSGFYVPNYPADRTDRIEMRLISWTTGIFTIYLEARENSFDGRLIGIAPLTIEFTGTVPVDVSFPFFDAPFPRGQTVTFQFQVLENTGPVIFFDIGPCGLGDPGCDLCGGRIVQTENLAPPLGSFRRNSVYVKIYSPPCKLENHASAPDFAKTGQSERFVANSWTEDCAGAVTVDWDFGDGTHSNQADAEHAYAAPGIYTWICRASLGGESTTESGIVRVGNYLFVKTDGSGDQCSQASPCSIETALVNANDGDTVILAAGTYTGTGAEVAKIEKTLAFVGGWDGTDSTFYPNCRPDMTTTLDGQGARRVIFIKPGTFPLVQCIEIRRGSSSEKGGGIMAEGASLTLRDVGVEDCSSDTQGVTDGLGGGLYFTGGDLFVYRGSFINNYASCAAGCAGARGGAIYAGLASSVEIAKSLFKENGAWLGGALHLEQSPFSITDCTFQKNGKSHMTGYGGAIQAGQGNGIIRRTRFEKNFASNDNGTIALIDSKADLSENEIICDNNYRVPGIGAYRCLVSFTNNSVSSGSSALLDYAALYLENSDIMALHNTFARNGGAENGTAFGILNGSADLKNNIFAGNGRAVFAGEGGSIDMDHTLWGSGAWANGTETFGPGSVKRSTDIYGDPLFASPDENNYHISVGSPAVDTGLNAGILIDIDGAPRPAINGYDIGADELDRGNPLSLNPSATPSNGMAPLEVAFSGDFNGGAPGYTYLWDFGDGESSADRNPHHTYTQPGEYHPIFKVTDGFGSSASETLNISVVAACGLGCQATVPETGIAGETVSFAVTISATHCAGEPTVAWDFGDGSSSAEQNPTHTYSAPGQYTWSVSVKVEDLVCKKTGAIKISQPCTLECGVTTPTSARAGSPVPFKASSTSSGCSGEVSYLWDFGDGATGAGMETSHTYSAAGTFTWTMRAKIQGISCTRTGQITISAAIPGDCDGDGAVSIGEVQKAINMFLGAAPPDCGVDCNGDGKISIGEVQKVINAFLGLPSSC